MKLLITGSRALPASYYNHLLHAIKTHYPEATEIWHGGANGADQLAGMAAGQLGLPCHVVRPDYHKYTQKVAPLQRNRELVRNTDATLAVHIKGLTTGTNHTAHVTLQHGNPLTVVNLRTGDVQRWNSQTWLNWK